MDSFSSFQFIIASAIAFFLWLPLCTLIHELGHAIVPVLTPNSESDIRVGPKTKHPLWQISIGKVSVQQTSIWKPWQGYSAWSYLPNNHTTILALIMGPAFSLLLALILFQFAAAITLSWLQLSIYMASYFALLQFLVTVLPLPYPSFWGLASVSQSDGMQIFKMISSTLFGWR